MTTTTETTTVELAPGALTLVTVSETFSDWPASTPEDRTFYATTSTFSDGYGTLVVPDSDPRSRGMWRLYSDIPGLVGDHSGWNVPLGSLSPYVDPTTTTTTATRRPASADLSEQGRRALPIGEAYPVGSMWTHRSYSDPVTIVSHPTDHTVRVGGRGVDGMDNRDWPRGALDSYGTFVGWADDQDTAGATPETFTREDVDRLVREAREQADCEAREALEAFKRAANERAVEYAEQNGLCSEFERCMEDIGLLGRDEWHDRNDDTYRVTFTVTVDVTARDESHAEDRAREELYEDLSYPMDQTIQHHSTEVL